MSATPPAALPAPASTFPHLTAFDLERLREVGAARTGSAAAARLAGESHPWGRFWVHVDLDVLRTEDFPAADYPSS